MDDLTQRALLLDFYGSLLTEKQREMYDLYFQQDLSLGEISELQGVSRTAVYDLVKRTDDALGHYEEKLGLVRKFLDGQAVMQELRQKLEELRQRSIRNVCLVEENAKEASPIDCCGHHSNEEIGIGWDKISELLNKLQDSW